MSEGNFSYNTAYHQSRIDQLSFLVTGGAGFIGSNLVNYLLTQGAGKVRVVDNLSNGLYDNIAPFESNPRFEFLNEDIRDAKKCEEFSKGMNVIFHQAALGSVPRSVKDPLNTHSVNATGFLHMIDTARRSADCSAFVYASSSSVYGDSTVQPKKEGEEGGALSPYAVTKKTNEYYARVYAGIYDFPSVGLRYFNVFGPNQNPDNPYAAVIPIFCNHFVRGSRPTIHGDGKTSRDFTFVENAVQANIRSADFLMGRKFQSDEPHAFVFNTACGSTYSLNHLHNTLCKISGKNIQPMYGPFRPGDLRHSLADISALQRLTGYRPTVSFEEGMHTVYNWYRKKIRDQGYSPL